jgi:protein TonB
MATHQGAVVKAPIPVNPVMDKLPQLDFDINPRLPAGPLVLPSPAMETVDFGAPVMDGIFSIGDLDAPLTPLVRMPPRYPIQAKRRGIEGWVKVNFMVNQQGLVEKIKIVDAHPAGVFDQSAIQSISTWRFNPGTVEGVAVSTLATQILKFELAK